MKNNTQPMNSQYLGVCNFKMLHSLQILFYLYLKEAHMINLSYFEDQSAAKLYSCGVPVPEALHVDEQVGPKDSLHTWSSFQLG